jgi:hypothetical protein
VTPPLCPCGQPCARVMGGSYQRLCQACIAALPRRSDTLGAERKRRAREGKRRQRSAPDPKQGSAHVNGDSYTHTPPAFAHKSDQHAAAFRSSLRDIAAEEDAWLAREERRRR